MSSLTSILHALIIEERDISELFDDVPKDIRKQVEEFRQELRDRFLRSTSEDERERILSEEDSLNSLWSELTDLRMTKIINKAKVEAQGGKRPDISGILPWEREIYPSIVSSFSCLLKSYGVVG